eukprot:COSAG02_NODE_4593_length_5182_cov_62.861275_1_plen_189_part_00
MPPSPSWHPSSRRQPRRSGCPSREQPRASGHRSSAGHRARAAAPAVPVSYWDTMLRSLQQATSNTSNMRWRWGWACRRRPVRAASAVGAEWRAEAGRCGMGAHPCSRPRWSRAPSSPGSAAWWVAPVVAAGAVGAAAADHLVEHRHGQALARTPARAPHHAALLHGVLMNSSTVHSTVPLICLRCRYG